jgi:transglycosylase-like protein with SLT domain
VQRKEDGGMDHPKSQRDDGQPDRAERSGEPATLYRPFDPTRSRGMAQRAQHVHDIRPLEQDGEPDRRSDDRRHNDRRAASVLGGRRQGERRRFDRRTRLAGAGLLAAVAFGVGGHEIASRMGGGPGMFGAPEPSTSVDVSADFHLPAWDKAALEPFIQEAAQLHQMSPSLIRAVIQTESRFNPLAVSQVGAQGLMQLMPATARHVGIENPFDPRENILGGTKYLSSMLDRFKGNTARALAAYNAGPTVVARHRGIPPFRETQGYVRKIQKLVQDTDAEFSIPAPVRVKKASLSRGATHKAGRGKATVQKASAKHRPVVRKASVRVKKPVGRRG